MDANDSQLLILFGQVGSGKSTQAKIISRLPGWTYLGTGELLREAVANQTPLGIKLEKILAAGLFASDEDMTSLVEDFLQRALPAKMVLDGFPRTLPQAHALHRYLADRGGVPVAGIHLHVRDEICRDRLERRGRVAISPRAEDRPEIIPVRLAEYRRLTEPILRWWNNTNWPIVTLDGSLPEREVSTNVIKVIDALHIAQNTQIPTR